MGADQKGRRPLVLRVSSALARICAERGVPVLLCPHTKTRLFPVDVANDFMMKVGCRGSTTQQRHIVQLIPIFALIGPCVALNMAVPLKPVSAARYCGRCGEEIALANDLDSEPDIDRDRRILFVEGEPRQWTPALWRLFRLLYRWRGNVVPRVRVDNQRQNLSMLRRLLAGSRYQIVTRKSIGLVKP